MNIEPIRPSWVSLQAEVRLDQRRDRRDHVAVDVVQEVDAEEQGDGQARLARR